MSVQDEIDRLTTRRAAEWFEIYRTGQEEHYPAFIAWLSEAPQKHLAEFLAIAGQYPAIRDTLKKALQEGRFDPESLLQRVHPAVRPLRAAELPERAPSPSISSNSASTRPRWRWGTGLAAVLVLAAGLGVYFLNRQVEVQRFETQVGEQRVVSLLDGSVITLNARSSAEVKIDSTTRDVRLIQGEALFKVAHETHRPFLVHTAGATVRAVGTQFNVYAKPDGSTSVAVLEGRVEVSTQVASTAPSSAPMQSSTKHLAKGISLAAGESARVAPGGAIERNDHADMSRVIAWRQRRLVFDRTSLEDIVREFNRYNRALQMRLENVMPGSYHFSGSFDADDPQSLALLLSREPDLVVEHRGGEIVVRRREDVQ